MQLGNYNILKVKRQTEHGLYLADEQGNEVLLPKKFVTPNMKEGTLGKAFVYKDSEDRLVATTQQPLVKVNEVAVLTVKEVNDRGAFLNWGLDKDLFLPFAEQSARVHEGDRVPVYVFIDRATERIAATTNLRKFIKNKDHTYKPNQPVDIVITEQTPIGYRVVIDNRHWGMIYASEVFEKITVGDKRTAFVKRLREDGKIDLALQKQGYQALESTTKLLLAALRKHKGYLPLSDDSAPELIKAELGLSKKAFKKAAGVLFKEGQITIEDNGIRLLDDGE